MDFSQEGEFECFRDGFCLLRLRFGGDGSDKMDNNVWASIFESTVNRLLDSLSGGFSIIKTNNIVFTYDSKRDAGDVGVKLLTYFL